MKREVSDGFGLIPCVQNPSVPCQIKQTFPKAKFVVILREPASRALSAVDMKRRHCSRRNPSDGDIWPFCCEDLFQPVIPKLENATLELKNLEAECADSKSLGTLYHYLSQIVSSGVLILCSDKILKYSIVSTVH